MYQLNDEQRSVVEAARVVADRSIAPHAADVDEGGFFPTEAIHALGEAGLLGLTVPKEYGGMGCGLRTAAAVLDEVAQRCASTAMVYLMHVCGISCYNARPDVAGRQLKAAAAGEHLSTLAWSERGSRSHFWAPTSQAVRNGAGVTINAEKSWVTSAGIADGYVISTRAAEGRHPTDTTLYLLLKEDAGFEVAGKWNALGMRGNASAPMTLNSVALADDRALSEPHQGFEFMLGVVLPWFQIGNAAISAGISEAATNATASHLTSRRFEHLDSKLADLPNLRVRLAHMRIETDRTRAHLSLVIHAVEEGSPSATLLVLESKAAAAESVLSVTDLAMRACGGAAFSKHLGVERNFRDARAANVMAPTTDVLHDFIGRALCGMEVFQ